MENIKFRLPTKDEVLKIYKKSPIKVVDLFVYVMLILMAFIFLYPFMHMVINSFKSYSDIINATVKWIPKNMTLQSYSTAIAAMRLEHTLPNSLIVTGLSTLGHVISCSFIGVAPYHVPVLRAQDTAKIYVPQFFGNEFKIELILLHQTPSDIAERLSATRFFLSTPLENRSARLLRPFE